MSGNYNANSNDTGTLSTSNNAFSKSNPPEMRHCVRLNAQQSNVTGVDMEVPMYTLKTSQSAGTLSSTRSSLDFETVVSDFLNPFD